ncbi:50S ribosomal protein L33 [Candidatus Daviesbacteria bacterium RIFCSPHIGHO2_12_FULL_37_16]|uniref:Large ribosomal subunit protein bL33 n=3 Tax=Candidatus Daviesiibacteriota TaxID=1752718 RepID=A0A0G0HZ18_9BACT|nr:MAG: 50S ribosomal protein L33 [Candidatus Daviesbacteria bacterium GW2011_GWB1_36_5]KKQ16121.1 MAG: 50S ribosomal protein L33 [Candidatus Daviesbacteria bacterium GW2011_GWA1_36_8]OGE31395.1 MAG: 50S ribosomal protein L33 [Candidatus Daviesbacteria bacterium RIFCSPHIGHO2_02_FULL_37_9]OGE36410.1 MAG: 50S ribosomal protein L33 [Candidatus Daviesbacteria bacterium RIFCSPHIGHO2_12_FULL_37_16]
MAKKDARQSFGLECGDCKSRNYITQRNTTQTTEKIALKKYCKECRKTTLHQEFKLK